MKKIISLILSVVMLCGMMIIPATAASTPFKDVKDGKWYTEPIKYVYENKLMNGMTDTTFEPDSPMSRAMLVTVLYRAEGEPAAAGVTPFKDLKAKWYKKAVAWAYENKVVNGTSDTTFSPDTPITREQIATIFFRFAQFTGRDTSAKTDLGKFPDGSKAAKFARDAMEWAVAEGLITGTKAGDKTLLDPKGNATRAQVATILMRYLTSKAKSLRDKIDEFLDKYMCTYHNKLDVVFNFGAGFTEANLAALLRQAAGLGGEVEIEIDNFDELSEDYGGCGDDAGDYGMLWPSASNVTFTDTVTGEVVEEEIAFSLRKSLSSAELYPNGVLGVCAEDADPDLVNAMEEMNAIAYGEEGNVFTGFNGAYTEAGVEAFFRELTGLTDADTYEFRIFGFDPHAPRSPFNAMFINKEAEDGRFDAVWNEFSFENNYVEYNEPQIISQYTEKPYPLVDNADVYVATDGSDSNPGTFDAPVATFDGAVAKVREIKAEKTEGDVIVAFKAGDYGPLSVTLNAEDSGTPEQKIVYCAYGDGDVTFNNGLDVTEDEFEDLNEEEKTYFNANFTDKIKKADLSSVIDGGVPADSVIIFCDGGLCDKARFPNKYPDGSDQLFTAANYNDKQSLTIFQPSLLRRLASYDELSFSTMETYGYIIRGYRKDSFKVASFDNDTKVLQIANWETSEFGVMRDWSGVDGLGIQLCLTNIPKELDNTHEYWINPATKTLYAFAPDGTYHIPVLGTMVDMEGVDDVTFRGLSFKNTSGSFIRGVLCHGVTLELCTFCGVSSKAGVYFDDNTVERSMGLTVKECDFSCAYGASLYVNGECKEQNRYLKRTDVIFDNNQVSTSNLVYDVECAVDMPHCCGLSVTHNRFCNTSRGAFSFSHSYDVNIEYNEFTGIMKNSEDGGAVYSNGSTDGWHVTVRHNFFDYMPVEGTGTFGYYVDDDTCGVEICNNLFYDAACPVMVHLGRDNVVHDNVFIHGGTSFSVGQRNEIDELGLEGAMKSGGEFRKTRNKWTKVLGYIETYPEFRAGIEQWCPEVLNYHLDFDNMDDPYFVMNPVNTVRDNVYVNSSGDTDSPGGIYEERYVTYSGNRGFTFAENPMFVNPTVGDYRLSKDAAGFPDVEFEKIGRY